MLKLFILDEDGDLKLDPNVLIVPAFKAIWDRDKVKGKHRANKELMYVFFVSSFSSPYYNLPEEDRHEEVVKHLFSDNKFVPDMEIQTAVTIYKRLQETPLTRMLETYDTTLEKFRILFETTTIKGFDAESKEIRSTMAELGDLIESRNKLEEQVKKEFQTLTKSKKDSGESILSLMLKKKKIT